MFKWRDKKNSQHRPQYSHVIWSSVKVSESILGSASVTQNLVSAFSKNELEIKKKHLSDFSSSVFLFFFFNVLKHWQIMQNLSTNSFKNMMISAELKYLCWLNVRWS